MAGTQRGKPQPKATRCRLQLDATGEAQGAIGANSGCKMPAHSAMKSSVCPPVRRLRRVGFTHGAGTSPSTQALSRTPSDHLQTTIAGELLPSERIYAACGNSFAMSTNGRSAFGSFTDWKLANAGVAPQFANLPSGASPADTKCPQSVCSRRPTSGTRRRKPWFGRGGNRTRLRRNIQHPTSNESAAGRDVNGGK
jgi:hypothetical protein